MALPREPFGHKFPLVKKRGRDNHIILGFSTKVCKSVKNARTAHIHLHIKCTQHTQHTHTHTTHTHNTHAHTQHTHTHTQHTHTTHTHTTHTHTQHTHTHDTHTHTTHTHTTHTHTTHTHTHTHIVFTIELFAAKLVRRSASKANLELALVGHECPGYGSSGRCKTVRST